MIAPLAFVGVPIGGTPTLRFENERAGMSLSVSRSHSRERGTGGPLIQRAEAGPLACAKIFGKQNPHIETRSFRHMTALRVDARHATPLCSHRQQTRKEAL